MLSGKTVLITGATGRIGPAMVRRVEELGGEAIPVVLPGYPAVPRTVPWSAEATPIAVDGPSALDALPLPDIAVHLHWRVDRTRPDSEQVDNELRWNVHDPVFLWKWLREREVSRFAFVSSIGVFGPENRGPIRGTTEPLPATPYGKAKLAGERFFTGFFEGTPTGVTHLRLSSVCSVGEHPSHLMSRLYAAAFKRAPLQINTGNVVHLLHVDEAVDLVLSAADRAEPGSYLLSGEPYRVEDVAETFERVTGRRLDAERAEPSGTISTELRSDHELLLSPWVRTRTLEESIRLIVAERTRSEGVSTPNGEN